MSDPSLNVDAHPPARIAELVEGVGLRKATLPVLQLAVLGVLAGLYIAFGAMLYTVVVAGTEAPVMRWVGGLAFSLGLVLVLVAGAELFTGNALMVMGWADGRITTGAVLRNWAVVYAANLAGSLIAVLAISLSGLLTGEVAAKAAAIAEGKVAIAPLPAFVRGVLCNVLVCLAVWLSLAAHTVTDRVLAIMLPVSAFVALGFEHSIANMYLIPAGWVAGGEVTLAGFLGNLAPVTLGNIFGGGAGVAGTYWLVYLRR